MVRKREIDARRPERETQATVSFDHPSGDPDGRSLGRKAIRPDRLAQPPDGHGILRAQPDGRGSLVEAHADRIYSLNLPDSHAHGVGTDASVHSEDGLFDLAQLGVRDRRNQGNQSEKYRRSLHSTS